MKIRYQILGPRLWLVGCGILLGYLARVILGAPEPDHPLPTNAFEKPLVQPSDELSDELSQRGPIFQDMPQIAAIGQNCRSENAITSHSAAIRA